jgi:ATP-binding cassette subfamily F protein 3
MAAIADFDGAVIMVTHNELFLHALAQRLIVFDQDQVVTFEGTYQEFLDKGGWGDDTAASPSTLPEEEIAVKTVSVNKKKQRRRRSAILRERAAKLNPIDQAIANAESTIETEERRLQEFNEEMVQASQDQDGARIAELSPAIHQCRHIIDENFEALEVLYEKKEAIEKVYDLKLGELGEGILKAPTT